MHALFWWPISHNGAYPVGLFQFSWCSNSSPSSWVVGCSAGMGQVRDQSCLPFPNGKNPRTGHCSESPSDPWWSSWQCSSGFCWSCGWVRSYNLLNMGASRRHALAASASNTTAATLSLSLSLSLSQRAAITDWDGDGDLDVIITSSGDGKVHYHEMVSGTLRAEEPQHPFGHIQLNQVERVSPVEYEFTQPVPVDWDNDGDMDLVLGPPDGRYFEQLADGTLREWPLDDSPFRAVVNLDDGYWHDASWQFLDCDGDGDFDLLRVRGGGREDVPLQACENVMHTLRCDHNYLCLGTNLSNFRRKAGPLDGFGSIYFVGLGDVADGRLQLIVSHETKKGAVLWKAGFCKPPDADACYSKGMCLSREKTCRCVGGHEGSDCSVCEAHFHSVQRKVGQIHDCKACPGDGSQVCYGRGICFDDATAKALPSESTAALMATGNGSCACHEESFYGSDVDGRTTCMDGSCPTGTEEHEGICRRCAPGYSSLEGGFCQRCGPGTYSLKGSTNCSTCPAGSIAKESGASACDACPAGKNEVNHQFCNECPAGFISSMGNNSCSKCPVGTIAQEPGAIACDPCPAGRYEVNRQLCNECPAGFVSSIGNNSCTKCKAGFQAPKPGSTICEPCAAGTYGGEGSAICSACPMGTVAAAGSGTCEPCDAGRFAKESITCEPCLGGTFAPVGSSLCQNCPVGHVSSCKNCESLLIRASPDATKQMCQIVAMDLVLALLCWITSTCFCFLSLFGCVRRIAIADLSAQGQKHVVTTSIAHYVSKRACPVVTFADTGVPYLASTTRTWKVKTLNMHQLTLHCSDEITMPLDTSIGHLSIKFPHVFFSTGVLHCPLIGWCLLAFAATAAAASQLSWSLSLLACGLGLCTASLGFALRRRWGGMSKASLEKLWVLTWNCAFHAGLRKLKLVYCLLDSLQARWKNPIGKKAEAVHQGVAFGAGEV